MGAINRRAFLATGAGTAGAAVLALSGSRPAAAAPGAAGAPDTAEKVDVRGVDGVVVHISNASRGEATIMGADSEVVVVDRALVAAVARAARSGNRGA